MANYNKQHLQRAEILIEELGLTDLSAAGRRVQLSHLRKEGEPDAVLELLIKALDYDWLENLAEYLEESDPGVRYEELLQLRRKSEISDDQLALLSKRLEENQRHIYDRLRPGLRIAKYVLGRPLYAPANGLSLVFHAYQENMERVIKFIHPVLLAHEGADAVERFNMELHHLQQLDGVRGVVGVIDWGIYEGSDQEALPYLVTQYIKDGLPITTYIKRSGASIRRTLELFAQVCGAVRAAHDKGIVHRDLKPDNILVDLSGQAWVIDFGLAYGIKPRSNESWSPSPGSSQYMTPEHISADYGTVSAHSDAYCLGLILYELLVGEPPYRVATPKDITHSSLTMLGERLPDYRGTVLEQRLGQALAKKPEDRCSLSDLQLVINEAKHEFDDQQRCSATVNRKKIMLGFMLPSLVLLNVLCLISLIVTENKSNRVLEINDRPMSTVRIRWEGVTGHVKSIRLVTNNDIWQAIYQAHNVRATPDSIENHRSIPVAHSETLLPQDGKRTVAEP